MLKQLYELFINVVTLAQRQERQEQKLQEQQRELKELTASMQRLAYELQRVNDELRRTSEREEAERRILKLELENQLLRAERGLPPAGGREPDEETK